jgi:hypothetical protein
MYKVQVYSKGHWYDRLSTSDLNKAIALLETHTLNEWSSRMLLDGKPTYREYFGLHDCPSDQGYPESIFSDDTIADLLNEVWDIDNKTRQLVLGIKVNLQAIG